MTPQDLIEASLRLRPDRIIVGELRGVEAFAYLRAINTGHPGSIATLHADTPALALEQLILMIMQANLGLSRAEIKDYVMAVVQVIVQLRRGEKGKRFVLRDLLQARRQPRQCCAQRRLARRTMMARAHLPHVIARSASRDEAIQGPMAPTGLPRSRWSLAMTDKLLRSVIAL